MFQNLLSILRLTPGESEAGYLRLQAVACLQQLCVGLRRRLRFHRDPSFYSAKEGWITSGLLHFYLIRKRVKNIIFKAEMAL